MGVNKVVFGDKVLIDITDATVTPETLQEGYIAYDASGKRIEGTLAVAKYTNLIPTAVDDDGSIYGAVGYKDSYRWSASGNNITAYAGGRISGWIPFEAGATYRVKNFGISTNGYVLGCYIVYEREDGSITAVATTVTSGLNFTVDSENDLVVFANADATITRFRISGYLSAYAPIITKNEEIT